MSVSDSDIAQVHDLFASLGQLSHRKMMGGLSIYQDGRIFAILDSEGTLFLKASGDFARALAAEGARKFEMEDGRGMNYWTMPEDALDDPDAASGWARRALDALN